MSPQSREGLKVQPYAIIPEMTGWRRAIQGSRWVCFRMLRRGCGREESHVFEGRSCRVGIETLVQLSLKSIQSGIQFIQKKSGRVLLWPRRG